MTSDQLFSGPVQHLQHELAQIRTGRAHPSFVENIQVEAYESTSTVKELASISMPEPQSLVIQPWDRAILKNIERALQESQLGLQPINDGQLIRLVFPPLTEERRSEFIKVANEKAEEARVAVRGLREKEMKKIKQQEQGGTISEDESNKQQKELQKKVDEAIADIKEIADSKEKEISTI